MLDWLYRALGAMLSFFDSITTSYAIALIFYALIFKIVFLPFSIKQQKNQIKMAKLTPKIELIRAKYKGRTDQVSMQKQQQEIMDFQQKEGYNPMSGCLPLLIQLPIIMLLYTVIQNPLSYIAKTSDAFDAYNANYKNEEWTDTNIPTAFNSYFKDIVVEEVKDEDGQVIDYNYTREITQKDVVAALKNKYKNEGEDVSKITEIELINRIYEEGDSGVEELGLDPSTIPNFKFLGVNLANTPSFKPLNLLVLIPILAAVSSWLSMWLTRKMNNTGMQSAQDAQAQASMKMMDLVMPLMTLFIAFNFSGMLGLYWIFQSLLGLLQSFILSKAMPLPKYTEEELREMKRQQKEAEKSYRQMAKGQPKYKSLHYIDEDDYDELPEIKSEGKSTRAISSDVPEIKD
ncbi:MAG: YidC/Oxa1 family membrane protein insertase [Clostridia bacterium]|nr:YidC/Oxa1 family membrane protein insertase [Clostridia bacterium]